MAEDQKYAEFFIEHLNLVEHPGDEDGYFKEAYRDELHVKNESREVRNIGTVAEFVQKTSPPLSAETFVFRLKSTEILFYHYGSPLTLLIYNNGINEDPDTVVLGTEVDKGQHLFYAVPKDTWFTRLVVSENSEDFCVYSCQLLPGFEPADFTAQKIKDISN